MHQDFLAEYKISIVCDCQFSNSVPWVNIAIYYPQKSIHMAHLRALCNAQI